jgi:AbiA family abortive infection protein
LTNTIDDETLENKVNNIFDELIKLKRSSIEPETFRHELQDEILKEIFDKRVFQILDSRENINRIRRVFEGFDFNRVKEYPLPIIIIILKDLEVTSAFKSYLLKENHLTTKDVDILLTYLCQIDFKDNLILEKLQHYEPMCEIVTKIVTPNLSHSYPGYYILCALQVQQLCEMPEVIEQIRHRAYNEKVGLYSVALNHLLNEFHAICYNLESTEKSKDYDVNTVVDFLISKGISHETCIGIRKLFDRRNSNQVSHPGSEDFVAWSVSKSEYYYYQSKVSDCLSLLIQSN